MTTERIQETHGLYEIIEHAPDSFWVDLVSIENFDAYVSMANSQTSREAALAAIQASERKLAIIKLIDAHTQEMEGYSYYGSNPGVSTEDYDSIAEDILMEVDRGL